jgi:hypothetical protein
LLDKDCQEGYGISASIIICMWEYTLCSYSSARTRIALARPLDIIYHLRANEGLGLVHPLSFACVVCVVYYVYVCMCSASFIICMFSLCCASFACVVCVVYYLYNCMCSLYCASFACVVCVVYHVYFCMCSLCCVSCKHLHV